MANNRKIQKAADAAYDKYVEVAAELLAAQLIEQANGATETSEATGKLRRRASAYRAQWETAVRRAEESQDRQDAR